MKKEYGVKHTVGALVVVLAMFILTLLFPHKFVLQYLDEDQELQTEVFNSTKEYNKRAKELKADSISYWLHLE